MRRALVKDRSIGLCRDLETYEELSRIRPWSKLVPPKDRCPIFRENTDEQTQAEGGCGVMRS